MGPLRFEKFYLLSPATSFSQFSMTMILFFTYVRETLTKCRSHKSCNSSKEPFTDHLNCSQTPLTLTEMQHLWVSSSPPNSSFCPSFKLDSYCNAEERFIVSPDFLALIMCHLHPKQVLCLFPEPNSEEFQNFLCFLWVQSSQIIFMI